MISGIIVGYKERDTWNSDYGPLYEVFLGFRAAKVGAYLCLLNTQSARLVSPTSLTLSGTS